MNEISSLRLLAVAVAVAVALLAPQKTGPQLAVFLLIPLVLIWFSELLGSAKGRIGRGRVDVPTPGPIIAAFGWAVLLFSAFVVLSERAPTLPSHSSSEEISLHEQETLVLRSVSEAQREAVRRYPSLGVAGTEFNRKFVARYWLYQQTQPEYFQDTAWPVRLAEEVAQMPPTR